MRIGMVGLGRMGANMVRRLHQRRPSNASRMTGRGEAVQAVAADGAVGAKLARRARRGAHSAARGVDHGAGGARRQRHCGAAAAARRGRHPHRRRQLPLPGRHPPCRGAAPGGPPLRRCRHQRRRARPRAGLLSDDRRRAGGLQHRSSRSSRPSPRAAAGRRAPAARAQARATAEMGYLHCGPNGAGHFVKMVHNGIEYGLMAAYAEGLNLLQHADAGLHARGGGCRDRTAFQPAPVPVPARYGRGRRSLAPRQHHFLAAARSDRRGAGRRPGARRGSAAACRTRAKDAGRSQAAVEIGVPAHVLTAALYSRFESRGRAEFADKLLSAMRLGFGGHVETEKPRVRANDTAWSDETATPWCSSGRPATSATGRSFRPSTTWCAAGCSTCR